nr:hypothetical protein [Tanacetum cinerariifolium]
MVSVTIQQDTSLIPPMTTPIIDLTSRPESPKVHQLLKATTTETTTTTIHPPPSQQQQSTTDSMMMKRIGKLEHIMANLIQDNKELEKRLDSHRGRLYTLEHLDIPYQVSKAIDEVVTDAVDWAMQSVLRNHFRNLPEADMKEILHQRMWETDSYKTHEDHIQLKVKNTAITDLEHMDLDAADVSTQPSPEQIDEGFTAMAYPKPPPLSPPAGPSGASRSLGASGSSQVLPPPPLSPSTNQEGQSKGSATPSSSKTAVSAEYQAWTTTDTRLRPSILMTHADLQMDDDMAPDVQAQSSNDEDIRNAHIPKNNWASALASTYSPPPEDSLLVQTGDMVVYGLVLHNVSKPLPLGGPPGQVTIQSDFFFNKDLEYLRYDSKGSRPVHTSEGDRRAVRTHMQILSIVRIEVFSMYGYNYMKKIVLRHVDLNEHVIAECDFKYLYPSDFEDLYLLNLQGHLNHLPPKDKKILTTAINLWTRYLVIRQRVEDF